MAYAQPKERHSVMWGNGPLPARQRHDRPPDGAVQPAPPPSSPFDWGDDERVRGLLGE